MILSYDGRRVSLLLTVITAALLLTAAYDHFVGARGDDRMIGLLGAAATTAIMAMAALETARVRVDPARRVIDWQQRLALRHRAGSVAFDDVRQVSVEVPIGDSGVPNRRIVLDLANGTRLPMTRGYRPDHDGAIASAAAALRESLGHREPTLAESVQLLLAQSRTVDAVKLVVAQEGVSLTEARRRVDELARDPHKH